MTEIKIGICDDEISVHENLTEIINAVLENENMEYKILLFDSGKKLVNNVKGLDIVFLDIEMPDLDGIETGQRIRRINTQCKIVMATSRVDRFKESFKIDTFRFVTKPFDQAEIKEVFDAYKKVQIGMREVMLYRNRIPFNIIQKKIKYITAYDSYTEFLVDDKKFRQESSLNQLEEVLDKRCFFRVHKRYIINMFWIRDVKKNIVYIGDEEIPIARRKIKGFEKFYLQFDLEYR